MLPATNFKWRTRDGREISPANMATTHLFNTVRVIWNAVMPDDAYFGGGRYYFNETEYPKKYLEDAVKIMLPTLMERKDIPGYAIAELRLMAAYCAKRGIKLLPPLRKLV